MSHIWYAVDDEHKLITAIGQGYSEVNLWYEDDKEMERLNVLLTRAALDNTPIRIVGENTGTGENYSDPAWIDPDAKIWKYETPKCRKEEG